MNSRDRSFTRAEQSAPAPTLNIARQGNSVTLGWQGAGFRLQERVLVSSRAWADSSASVVAAGDKYTATIVSQGVTRFYRSAK